MLAIQCAGLAGKKVAVMSYTSVATLSALLWLHCTPVFVDIEPDTLCLSPELLRKRFQEEPDIAGVLRVLLLKSAQARAIWFAIRAIRNAWPFSSEEVLFTALAECEKEHAWTTSNISSPKQRQEILSVCKNSHDWISKSFFAGQPRYEMPCAVQKDWFPYAGLSDDCFSIFAEALPVDEGVKLLQRLDIVQPLLNSDQKRIADSLKRIYTGTNSAVKRFHHKERDVLSVITLAYNQEKYIADCIESVASQQTNFRFKHIILDHASQDSTPDIISRYAKKYGHIAPVRMPTHRRSGENVRTLFSVMDTPYVAVCVGDDYFNDPLKLQKQVDFLEKYQECALCFHPVDVIYEDGSPSRVYPPEDMLPGGVRRFYTISGMMLTFDQAHLPLAYTIIQKNICWR